MNFVWLFKSIQMCLAITPNIDASYHLYQAYYARKNKRVHITVKSGNHYHGYFVGFCRGQEQLGEPYILYWHFSPKYKLIGLQEFPDLDDCMIAHAAILKVEFNQDQTILHF